MFVKKIRIKYCLFKIGFTDLLLLFPNDFFFLLFLLHANFFFICVAVYVPLFLVFYHKVNASCIVHGSQEKLYKLENI